METYVFLTNQYLPKPGATGLCVHQLAKTLVNDGNKVYSICYKDGDSQVEFDGVIIRKITVPGFLLDNQSASDIKRKIQYCNSLFSKFVHLKYYPLRSTKLVNNYVNEIVKILDHESKIKIIASYTPLEAVIAAVVIKKRFPDRVKIVYYSTDTLSNEQGEDGILSAEYRTYCGIRWEKYLFKYYDLILVMECHKDHYMTDDYKKFRKKIKVVGFPLFSKLNSTNDTIKNQINDKLHLVYAGTLYQKLRNPSFLTNILVKLGDRLDYKASFLGGGDCEKIMREAEEASNNRIEYLGMQPHEIALDYICNADVLLSIGNIESPMAPSKIYEYISTGKPIIHTYSYHKDPCIEPLTIYQNALLLKEGDNCSIEKITDFIGERHNLLYDDVVKKFFKYTSQYTTDIIYKL